MAIQSPEVKNLNMGKDEDASKPQQQSSRGAHSISSPSRGKFGPQPGPNEPLPTPGTQKIPSWKRALATLGLSPMVIMFMIKGALAPTICMARSIKTRTCLGSSLIKASGKVSRTLTLLIFYFANGVHMYQRHSLAAHYLNLGYVMIVISILTVPMLPRGKFLMNLFIGLLLTCFAAAMVLFGHWCANEARKHTTPAEASPKNALGYNSSASAVNAIFMIVNIFGINTLRAARPSLTIPSVVYTIYVLIGFSYGPQEATNNFSLRFTRELFYAFLTGQAVSAGVSLLIIPVSSRKVFFTEATAFLQSARGLLKTQLAFIEALENSQKCEQSLHKIHTAAEEKYNASPSNPGFDEKTAALRTASASVLGLGSKLREDVLFAKREAGYGYLGGSDIHELHQLLRNIMIPISGLSTISDIAERLRNRHHSDKRKFEESQCPEARRTEMPEKIKATEQAEWQELIQSLHASFEPVIQVLGEGILHVMIVLKLIPGQEGARNRNCQESSVSGEDIEKGASNPMPGDFGFGDYLDLEIQGFRKQRSESLELWAKDKGLGSIFHTSAKHVRWPSNPDHGGHKTLQSMGETRASQRLHLILYMEYLLYSVAKAVLALVRFVETKVEDGTMKNRRLIFPAMKTISKWVRGIIQGEDSSPGINNIDNVLGIVETVYLGDSLRAPKDPEHLPPKNLAQVIGNKVRVIPRLLGSDAVRFGVRVSLASISIGIMAYLKNTHAFYIRQRVVWAMVMIAIGMNPTSGSAVFTLLGNLTATVVAMVFSFINWYVVDQKTAGVIVVFFLFQILYFYFAARNPRFLVPIVAGAITHVLIIGYELQVRVIGEKVATSTGQAFYPIYELAPYRLLTVAGGVIVAYIWTIFPVPITEGTVLRRDLGCSLFLLANYLSSVTSTVDQRVQGREGDMGLKSSPGRQLEKTRQKVLQKQLALLTSMRQNIIFMAWEPSVGGDFPKRTYQAIIAEVQNVVNYLTIISYASEAFSNARADTSSAVWLSQFSESRVQSDLKSHEITSLLSLLSASLRNNQALPPYLKGPIPYHLSEQIQESDTSILAISNINEPGFRAFAVIEVAHLCLVDSVTTILKHVRDLVGEVDFTYQIRIHSGETSNSSMEDNAEGKQKAH